jgi:hypothetical protein
MTAVRFTNAQVALIALCAVLSAVLFYELFAPLREYHPPAIDNTHAAYNVALPAMYTPPAFETFANIDEKSVFNPLRTAIVTDSGGTATAAGDALPSDLALVGVIMDGPVKMALLKSSEAPLAVGVPEGGVFEGWQVASVEADKVVFAAHGDRQELKLSENKPPAAKGSDQSDDDSSSDDNKPADENKLAPQVQPQAQPHPPTPPIPARDDNSDKDDDSDQ